MGVWRMEIDMSFATEDEMKSMLNLIEAMRDKLQKKIDPELPIPCQVRYHECLHDVGQACSGYVTHEFDGVTDHGIPAEDVVPKKVKDEIKKEPDPEPTGATGATAATGATGPTGA